MANLITYPAQVSSMIIDFQLAQLSIGEEPATFHPATSGIAGIKARREKGEKRRREGVYELGGMIHNHQLRKGQIGYPVILPGVDYGGAISMALAE